MRKFHIKLAKLLLIVFITTNVFTQDIIVMASEFSHSAVEYVITTTTAYMDSQADPEKTQIIVKYKEKKVDSTTSVSALMQSLEKTDGQEQEKLKKDISSELKLKKLDTVKAYEDESIEVLEIKKSDDIKEVVDALNDNGLVEYAQPNYKLSVLTTSVTDDRYPEQWPIYEEGTASSSVGIHVKDVWDMQGDVTRTTLIGVLDTGIDIEHTDLKHNIFTNNNEIPGNGIDDDGNGYIDDYHGYDFANDDASVYDDATKDKHGTHVAGIIAADDNGSGILGVAKDMTIIPLKFIDGTKGFTSDAIEAIDYAKTMGVDIINCSFGSTDNNPALKEAIANSGIVFVASAGNAGQDVVSDPVYPACFDLDNIISVTSYDAAGELGVFANYGSGVDIAAPGADIISTVPEGGYQSLSGTSTAAPFVSGVMGLIKNAYPDITPKDLIARVKSNAVAMPGLVGKTNTGGRVDAFRAVTGTQDIIEETTNTEINSDEGTFVDGVLETLSLATVSPELLEQVHYGETGVNAATGNYSTKAVDLSIESPGFTLNMSRTYNSKNDKNGSMGRGWTFGFEGSLKVDTSSPSLYIAKMPNGSSHTFTKNGSTYTANDFRGRLVATSDGWVLTTADQYTYGYNSSGWLIWMKDPSGNTIRISVDNTTGYVQTITDQVGRVFFIAYNEDNKISTITDPMNHVITYTYEDDLLKVVTDQMGRHQTYDYNASKYLISVKNHHDVVTEAITYNNAASNGVYKVKTYTNNLGNVFSYTYGTNKTTITDTNNRVIEKTFDPQFYVISSKDPEGKSTFVEYYKDSNGINRYGEEKKVTDRLGNVTSYERNTATGNIEKIFYPDGSYSEYEYDDKNNTRMEQDPEGNKTFYIYDADKVKLLQEIRPINGVDSYSIQADQSKFNIKSYTYYSEGESKLLGYKAKNLLKSVTDPEGNTISYTYDNYGNIKTSKDAEGFITTTTRNILGWTLSSKSPSGYITSNTYNSKGQLVKQVEDNGETTRYVYDDLGRLIQEIDPNTYDPSKDGLNLATPSNTYSDSTVGLRYQYNSKNQVIVLKDALNNARRYTYGDLYGNITQEELPNGLKNIYTYDVMNRQVQAFVKADAASNISLKEETIYEDKEGNSIVHTKKYLAKESYNDALELIGPKVTSKDIAESIATYDFADRLITQVDGDGALKTISYYKNGLVYSATEANGATTYYRYDAGGNLTGKWTPVEASKYMYTGFKYDKAGRAIESYAGRDLVGLDVIPSKDRMIITYTTYNKKGQVVSQRDSAGRKTAFEYTGEGNVKKTTAYITDTKTKVITKSFDHLGHLKTKSETVFAGDLSGHDMGDTNLVTLTESYDYDLNGNLIKVRDVNGLITSYTYDKLNRRLSTTYESLDENLARVYATVSNEYDANGNIIQSTDAMGIVTSNVYSQEGYLEQVKKTVRLNDEEETLITAYQYDQAGRLIREVSPNNCKTDTNGSVLFDTCNRTEYTYDKMGRQLTATDIYQGSGGTWKSIRISNQYDISGNVVKVIDGQGYETNKSYTLQGQLKTITDPEAKAKDLSYTTLYSYDGIGRIKTETNALGVVTTNYYDDANNKIRTTIKQSSSEAEYTLSSASYDLAGNQLSVTDGNRNTTIYVYNSMNKVAAVQYSGDDTIGSYVIAYQYDKKGNCTYQEDSLGQVQLFTYDLQNRLLKHTTKDSEHRTEISQSTKYDLNGNPRFMTDANGTVITRSYNELNQLQREAVDVRSLDGDVTTHETTYTYDKNGNNIGITDYLGNTITTKYDPLNRVIEKVDPSGASISKMEYNNNHVQVKAYDGKNNATQYFYDKKNQLIKTIDPEGGSTRNTYDALGNKLTSTDARGYMTSFSYDTFGRLNRVENAKGEVTTYTYDLMNNLLTQTDGNGNTTTRVYNVRNQLVKTIDPKGITTSVDGQVTYDTTRTESLTYTPNGLVKEKVDRNGNLTTFTYDTFGRKLEVTSGSDSISSTYDNNGNLLTITDETGKTLRTYDELGRVIMKSVPIGGAMTFVYDITDGLEEGKHGEKSTDSKGNTTTKVYDSLGRLETVNENGRTTTYTYDANGNKKSATYVMGFADTFTETYEYNKNNQLESIITRKADQSVMASSEYTYDVSGNQLTKTERGLTTTYGYDCLNRLERVSDTGAKTTTYIYDGAGNRIKETVIQGLSTSKESLYTYNEQKRLMTTTSTDAQGTRETVTYTYDPNGNNTYESKESKTFITNVPVEEQSPASFGLFIPGQAPDYPNQEEVAGFEKSYQYNNFNQMVKATTGSTISQFVYNGEGRRTKAIVNGETTVYVYQGDKVVLELDGKGKEKAHTIYGGNRLISRTMGSDTALYMLNGHGDVTGLVGSDGDLMATYTYDAFGNITESNTTQPDFTNPFKYAGYQYDDGTGLYYLNARMYNAKTARFMQMDSYLGNRSDPLSLNLYTYVSNNPVKYYDPTGHMKAGDECFSKDVQYQLAKLTDDYFNTTDETKRKKIAKEADKIRNSSIQVDNGHATTETAQFLTALNRSNKKDVNGNAYIDGSTWKSISSSRSSSSTSDSSESTVSPLVEDNKDSGGIVSNNDDGLIEETSEDGINNIPLNLNDVSKTLIESGFSKGKDYDYISRDEKTLRYFMNYMKLYVNQSAKMIITEFNPGVALVPKALAIGFAATVILDTTDRNMVSGELKQYGVDGAVSFYEDISDDDLIISNDGTVTSLYLQKEFLVLYKNIDGSNVVVGFIIPEAKITSVTGNTIESATWDFSEEVYYSINKILEENK